MANTRENNVIICDTTATTYAEHLVIKSIKYIGASSGTANIKAESTSGDILWEEAGTANVLDDVCIKCPKGIYVTLTNSAKIYIYLA